MELGLGQGWRVVGAVVLFLVATSYLEGVQGTSPPGPLRPPRPDIGITLPYVCPHEVTLSKLKFKQGEFKDYIQYTRYDVVMPYLSGFTIHYWFNLASTTNTSTMFSYGRDYPGDRNILTVQLQHKGGRNQFFNIYINNQLERRVRINPPVLPGNWNHALHTWDSDTGRVRHYLNGKLLESYQSYHAKGVELPGGGMAISGQHLNALLLYKGVDQGEGLNGWLTLFQMSSKSLALTPAVALAKAKLAAQCSSDMEGDVISWTTTPRKSHGGVMETPSFSKACGLF